MGAFLSQRGGAGQLVDAMSEQESDPTGFSGQLASAFPVLGSWQGWVHVILESLPWAWKGKVFSDKAAGRLRRGLFSPSPRSEFRSRFSTSQLWRCHGNINKMNSLNFLVQSTAKNVENGLSRDHKSGTF